MIGKNNFIFYFFIQFLQEINIPLNDKKKIMNRQRTNYSKSHYEDLFAKDPSNQAKCGPASSSKHQQEKKKSKLKLREEEALNKSP